MPLEAIQLFLSNIFQVFLLPVQLYMRCLRLYHSHKSTAVTFGLVIHPHQSVRVELYDCNNDFTTRAGLLHHVYIRESTGVRMYARNYPYSSDSSGTIARENIAWRALSILRRILIWTSSSSKLQTRLFWVSFAFVPGIGSMLSVRRFLYLNRASRANFQCIGKITKRDSFDNPRNFRNRIFMSYGNVKLFEASIAKLYR